MRLLIVLLILSPTVFAQIGTGQWRLHVPSLSARDVAASNNKVFTAFQNGVSEYDLSSSELSVWDAVNGLSDITVSCLGASTANNSVFIGYENGNIDKIKDNQVTNIPAIKLAQIQGSKKIYAIREYQGYMYIATGFAIVKIDPVKNEVRDTYYPTDGNAAIIDVALFNDTIYALTKDRMYRGYLNNVALASSSQWSTDSRVPILSADNYQELEYVNGNLFLLFRADDYGVDTVFQLTPTGVINTVTEAFPMEINSISVVNNRLAFNYVGATIVYESNFSYHELIVTASGFDLNPRNVIFTGGHYYVADGNNGLVKAKNGGMERIAFSGPPRNDFYALDWQKGKLAAVCGGITGITQNYNFRGLYTFEDEEWQLKDRDNQTLWGGGAKIYDYLSVAINPKNKDEMAVGTFSFVPLSLIDASGNVVDTLTPVNSILETTNVGIGQSMVSGLQYDEDGNLWILNGGGNKPLKVKMTDGNWQEFDFGPNAKTNYSGRLVIDYNGHKWFGIRNNGLFGLHDNGTPMDVSDDQYIQLNSGASTGALPSDEVTAIAVDFDNEIWIGTDAGFAILYNSESAFGASPGNYNAQQVKLDFEGNVEIFLGTTHVTDIEVDGANRKWFGTANSGIILVSADGQEIIEQHTMENSPLISNVIIDLEIDHSTGELFIVTDLGLVSYRTDATYEDPNYSNVKVFPNPKRPDYNGPITIQGIRYDSDVKITDVAGNVVYKTTSNGGTATWDGKTLQGEPAATGVYLIWTAPNEGKGRKVGKVLIVN